MIFKRTIKILLPGLILGAVILSSCIQENDPDQSGPVIPGGKLTINEGYYTAEGASFDNHGWKEFLTVYIDHNRIVTVEYDAKNSSGFLKSWDMEYMREMKAVKSNYPTRYTRTYATALLNRQDPAKIDVLTGATNSYKSFKLLAEAVIEQAKAGDRKVAQVELPEN
ncbi:major membrane immunogen [Treponema primitia ZAS-2]|uniref:Major membrane immunogen n=1 Tax=Treponema primitia (strain ATCC BAA-887 / DSM 12427 / ZAS-2) TaxID=545694 RepID=F5YHM5_TREPZ|nr:major membrane immunogen [Treponema primitia]AEF83981.1 major membrane immunogen [Treponema primitia ZAS-2]